MTEIPTPPASDSVVAPPSAPAAAPTETAPPPAAEEAPPADPAEGAVAPAEGTPPEGSPETDPRATARLIRERDTATEKLKERDASFASLEADYRARADADRAAASGRQPSRETAEERQTRYDANPLAFYDAERRTDANRAATEWLMTQPEASGDKQFLSRVLSIAQELNLDSDNPKRDSQIALHFYKSRFPAAAAPPTSAIDKSTLNPGGSAPPAISSEGDFDKKLAELQRTDPEAAAVLWAKERQKRGWTDDS